MVLVRAALPDSESVSAKTIEGYESGKLGRVRPNLNLLAALSQVLNLPLDDFAPGASQAKEQVIDLLSRIGYYSSSVQAKRAIA
jgi:transcriptional regulator with XRE-family HTH domain